MISLPIINSSSDRTPHRFRWTASVALLMLLSSPAAVAQDVRWSWFEISYVNQDIDQQGTQVDFVSSQIVDADAQAGKGIKFRASLGTWHNFFAFVDFNSSDIDVDVIVSNASGSFPASDQFDYTAIRGGIGFKWPLTNSIDIYAAASYDSTDFDFGSFAGENFDTGDKDVGGQAGFRWMLTDQIEFRAHARYSSVGAVNLTTRFLDDDTLYGAGFSYELVRGLSLVADYESGEFTSWNVGFRLDLSED